MILLISNFNVLGVKSKPFIFHRFTAHMEEIMARQLELQKQIRQEGREVRDMKANATARSVHVTTGRAISNAALNEHFK